MTTLLISGIGGDIAQGVAQIIREVYPSFRLIGADIHACHAGSLFVDDQVILPRASDAGYLEALSHVLESSDVSLFLPMTEAELQVLQENRRGSGVPIVDCGPAVMSAGLNKLKTYQALCEAGLPAPWTVLAGESPPLGVPCILKPRMGSGSRSIHVVRNAKDAERLAGLHPDFIFQELLLPADQEVTAAVYRRADGVVASLLLLRRLTGGLTSWARVIEDAVASEQCEKLANHLDLRGSMNVQMRLTEAGPRIFEVNPRLSSTALMRHRLGFTDAVWAIEEALGRRVKFNSVPAGLEAARTHGASVLPYSGVAVPPSTQE